jgi:small subunit ribosomal protein S16
MVRIRLRRIGLKGQPTYRIVAADKEMPRDGRFLEILGVYNPRTEPSTIRVKEERVYHWMKNGALPTESVAQVFKTAGILDRFERFKKGEALETLLAEATEAETKRAAPMRTRKN